MEILRYHNLHLPDEVAVFSVPLSGIRRHDTEALVYDVRVGPNAILRHYAFYHHWFEVNVSFDANGSLVTEPGPVDWCFNCDVSMPLLLHAGDVYNADLCLDILVAPDGLAYAVKDEDEFDDAIKAGWIEASEVVGARRGLAELQDLLESCSFLDFLQSVCPWHNVTDAPLQPPLEVLRLADVPLLQLPQRLLVGKGG